MKIGTLTFHRACNSGAVLQAYALERALNSIEGVQAEIIDYSCEKIDYAYTSAFCFYNCNLLKGFLKYLIRCKSIRNRNNQFMDFRKKYLTISKKKYDKNTIMDADQEYDLVICGSDQIWNYELTNSDTTYLLDFVKDSDKKASYAVSFGISEIDETHKIEYKNLIDEYRYLSMRETSASEIVSALINRECKVHIDPVFLQTSEEWSQLCKTLKEKNYVLIYMVGMGRIVDEMIDFAKMLARQNNLELLFMNTEYISYLYADIKHIKNVAPDMFLSYIKEAEYIVTNSFHATCFSILFHKQFYTETGAKEAGGKKSGRVINLLEKSGLSHHIINKGKLIHDQHKKDDWDLVDKIIEDEANISLHYLQEIVRERKQYNE